MVLTTDELDELDLQLLDALQRNARSTFAELGSIVGLQSAGRARSRQAARTARLHPRLFGATGRRSGSACMLTAFVSCYTSPDCNYDEFTRTLGDMPEVCEVHSVAGEETLRLQGGDALDQASRRTARPAQGDARNGAHAHDHRAHDAVRPRRDDGAIDERRISERHAHPLGTHRVLEPAGAMPQAAWRLDNTPVALDNEILCDVEILNIDSASFKQIRRRSANGDAGAHRRAHRRNRRASAASSTIRSPAAAACSSARLPRSASAAARQIELKAGDRIASLVSLTLTPLHLEAMTRVDVATGRVWMRGKAMLFESGLWAKLPDDIDENVALAVLDVAGAPAQVRRLCKPGQTVVVIGADGKSGMLSCAQANAPGRPGGARHRHRPASRIRLRRSCSCAIGLVDDAHRRRRARRAGVERDGRGGRARSGGRDDQLRQRSRDRDWLRFSARKRRRNRLLLLDVDVVHGRRARRRRRRPRRHDDHRQRLRQRSRRDRAADAARSSARCTTISTLSTLQQARNPS